MRAALNHVRARSVSYVALFLALSGSAFAAVSVQGRDVVDRTLTGADVRPGALTANVLEPGAISSRGRRGPRGPRGFTGPRGFNGATGPAGAAGTLGLQVVTASQTNPADTDDTTPDTVLADVRCPVGTIAFHGGGKITSLLSDGQTYEAPSVHFRETYPLPSDPTGAQGWRVIGTEELGGVDEQWTVNVWAFCGRF